MVRIGVAFDPRLANAGAFCGAVAALGGIRSRAVELNQHGVINVATKRALNGVQVGPVAVAG